MPETEADFNALHARSNQKFLKSLFELNKDNRQRRRRLFEQATDAQIKVTLRVLRLLWTGAVPVRGEHEKIINKAKHTKHIATHFKYEENYKAFKGKTLTEQKQMLSKIRTWKELLHNLFEFKK
jgi:hypothetical protein